MQPKTNAQGGSRTGALRPPARRKRTQMQSLNLVAVILFSAGYSIWPSVSAATRPAARRFPSLSLSLIRNKKKNKEMKKRNRGRNNIAGPTLTLHWCHVMT